MIAVGIVEAYPIYQLGLAHSILTSPDMTLLRTATSVEEYEHHTGNNPDVMVLGLELSRGGLTGREAIRHFSSKGIQLLVTSIHAEPETVVDIIAAGASGFLAKASPVEDVAKAIRLLAAGESYVTPTLASHLLRAARGYHRTTLVLTAREQQVLKLVATGITDQDIAERLHISISGVRSHLERIRTKSGRRRRADLTRLAMEKGLLEPDR